MMAPSRSGDYMRRVLRPEFVLERACATRSWAYAKIGAVSADHTTVYTDGACLGNPGPGGWAWAVPGGDWACGADPATTNQRMELRAVLEALRELDGPVEVVSDSTYVVNCFRDRWYDGWLRRGWRNSHRKPVANRDLWEPLIELYLPSGGGDRVPVGEGPLRRRVERDRRPVGVGSRGRPALPPRPLAPCRADFSRRGAEGANPAPCWQR